MNMDAIGVRVGQTWRHTDSTCTRTNCCIIITKIEGPGDFRYTQYNDGVKEHEDVTSFPYLKNYTLVDTYCEWCKK